MRRLTFAILFVFFALTGLNCSFSNYDIDPNPGSTQGLRPVWEAAVPRHIDAMFKLGSRLITCTQEDGLYAPSKLRRASYLMTSIDLNTGSKGWTVKDTLCAFRVAGEHAYIVRQPREDQATIARIALGSGVQEATFTVAHKGCPQNRLMGSGERMFSRKPIQGEACFDLAVVEGSLLFVDRRSVQVLDRSSGQVRWQFPPKSGPFQGQKVERVIAAQLQGGVAYVMYTTPSLAASAQKPSSDEVKQQASRARVQLTAIEQASQKVLWNAGPFAQHMLHARLAVHKGQLLVQTLSANATVPAGTEDLFAHLAPRSWPAETRAYLLDQKLGKALWSKAHLTSFARDARSPQELFLSPIRLRNGSAYLESPQAVTALQIDKPSNAWTIGTQALGKTEIYMVDKDLVRLRGSNGHSLMVEHLKPFERPVERGRDLFASSEPTSAPATPKRRRVSARGICVKIDGSETSMDQIQTKTRFFLPPPGAYYFDSTAAFFNIYCNQYKTELKVYDFPSGARLWKGDILTQEAPIFYFMDVYARGQMLYAMSDNGDVYGFELP